VDKTSPFSGKMPTGGHVIGQPFTLTNLSMPVNATLTCNCAVPFSEMTVVSSAPVTCPACQQTYIVVFNPQSGQIVVAKAQVEEPKVPS
jgi:hypothetical protein